MFSFCLCCVQGIIGRGLTPSLENTQEGPVLIPEVAIQRPGPIPDPVTIGLLQKDIIMGLPLRNAMTGLPLADITICLPLADITTGLLLREVTVRHLLRAVTTGLPLPDTTLKPSQEGPDIDRVVLSGALQNKIITGEAH